jgi:hypothetical protein
MLKSEKAMMVGFAMGTRMRKMIVSTPAPSTRAASTMSSLICMKASRMRKVPSADTA